MQNLTPICDDAYFIAEYRTLPNGSLEIRRRLEEVAYNGEPPAWDNGWAWLGPLTFAMPMRHLSVGFHRPQIAIEGELLYFWDFMPWIQVQPYHHGEFLCVAQTVFPARVTDLPFTTRYEIRLLGEVIGHSQLRVVPA